MNYNPLTDPFELPVQIIRFDCVAERPLRFSARAGASPGTTLWGAFGDALLARCCVHRENGRSLCGDAAGGCLRPEECPGRWLYKPRSIQQNRDLARPVLLHARELENGHPCQEFELEAVLWGRHAVRFVDRIVELVERMSERGLNTEKNARDPVRFRIGAVRAEPEWTLAERIEAAAALRPAGFLLTFETPFIGEDKASKSTGGIFSLSDILGRCAFDLVAWDMEDRELGSDLSKPRHKLCLDARDEGRRAAAALRPVRCELVFGDTGRRVSRTHKTEFSLNSSPTLGFVGQVEFTGDCGPALPWLMGLSLGGGGARRAWGFGRVGVDWWATDRDARQYPKGVVT